MKAIHLYADRENEAALNMYESWVLKIGLFQMTQDLKTNI